MFDILNQDNRDINTRREIFRRERKISEIQKLQYEINELLIPKVI